MEEKTGRKKEEGMKIPPIEAKTKNNATRQEGIKKVTTTREGKNERGVGDLRQAHEGFDAKFCKNGSSETENKESLTFRVDRRIRPSHVRDSDALHPPRSSTLINTYLLSTAHLPMTIRSREMAQTLENGIF